jgi:hypothetical protein
MEGPLLRRGRCGVFFYCAAMETGEFVIMFRLCDPKATVLPATGDQYDL